MSMTVETARSRLCVALDVDSLSAAEALVRETSPYVGLFKIGLELYISQGHKVVEVIHELGGQLFLDLKFHDIPNTVAGVARVATRLGVKLFNVHSTGGKDMMTHAVAAVSEEAAKHGLERPQIVGVTVLTSLSEDDFTDIGLTLPLDQEVLRLAKLTKASGLDGVIASPHEISAIKTACGPRFLVVTPGIRLGGEAKHDQRRIMTPRQAIAAGADYIVVGRTITGADNKGDACKRVLADMAGTVGNTYG